MKGASYAWVVVVPGDERVPDAVLSSLSIKNGETMGSTVALIPHDLSSASIATLNSGFDMVIVSNPEKSLNSGALTEFLFLECWKLSSFSKVIALHPGVIPARSTRDAAFDFEQGLLENSRSNLYGIVVSPCKKLHAKLQSSFLSYIHAGKLPSLKNALENTKTCYKVVGNVISWEDLESRDDHFYEFHFLSASLNNLAQGHDINTLNETQQQLVHVYTSKWLHVATPHGDLPPGEDTRDWVSVIGMGCRFPDSNNPEEYWDMLVNGRNTCGPLPPYRVPLLSAGSTPILANYLKCNITEFDAGFFGMSPSEAAFTDPQQRMLLEVSWEAFEDAGINPEELRGSGSGVFHGGWTQEYRDCFNEYSPPSEEYTRKYCGNGLGSAAAKLSLFYGFTGPNVAAESACSSSMMAVELAVKSLQQRDCPLALATGTSLLLHLTPKGQVWSPEGISRTFDAKANGYGRAEGIAVLVMKRYCDAVRDGDRMYGVIRGTGASQEGLSRSFGSPTVESEVYAMKKALENARVSPNQVDFVEAHATGTNVGDPVEATAICEAYKNLGDRKRPLYIASGKTNIGHSESSSGIAGMCKTLLALKNGVIPPHINFTEMNPKISFESILGQVPVAAIPWPREANRTRIAGVSGFGITGTDVHIIVQEAPNEHSIGTDTFPCHVVTVSGKNESALEQASSNLLQYLESTQDSLANIAYTSTACRYHHSYRTAYWGQSISEIVAQITQNRGISGKVKSNPKITFAFPSSINFTQVTSLYKSSSIFRSYFNHCDAIVKRITSQSLISSLNENSLTCLGLQEITTMAAEYSLAKMWMALGVTPEAVVGHHLGEIVAAVIKGTIKLDQAIKMVSEYQSGNSGDEIFQQILATNSQQNKNIQLISGVTGKVLNSSQLTPTYWLNCLNGDKHLNPVVTTLETDATVEMGFGNNSCGISQMLQIMSQLHILGVNLNWKRLYENVSKVKVSLPTYPFQRKSYWFDKTTARSVGEISPAKIHPLLGSSIQNASDFGIFQNELKLEKLPYLSDHCITTEVIYPAAAHLENMLGAGCHSLNGGGDTQNFIRRPPYTVQIEDFSVHQPLHVSEAKTKLQTVVKPVNDGNYTVTVHGLKVTDKTWRTYATGTFSPGESNELVETVDLQQVIARCPENSEATSNFYTDASNVGLQFGPKFQSLQKIYSGQGETLAQLSPGCYGDSEYLCHPVAVDAMLQLFIYHTMPHLKKLHVPVAVAKLIMYPTEGSGQLFAYCKSEAGGVTNKVCLLNGDGNTVAVMVHPKLIATTAQSVVDAAGCNLPVSGMKIHPNLYEQFWKPGGTLGNVQTKIPSAQPGVNTWLILHDDAPEIADIVTWFQKISRKCVPVSLKSLETARGKLQDEIDRIMNQHKNCEGILFIATPSHGIDVKQGRHLVEPLLCISKHLLKSRQKLPRFHVVTRGSWVIEDEVKVHKMNPMLATVWGYMRTLRAEMPTITSKSIDLDPDLGDDVTPNEIGALINELFDDNKENEVVFRDGHRYFRRLKISPGSHKLLEFPDACEQITVLLPQTKALQDLKYVPKSPGIVHKNQLEIEIRSSSLNFKDVFNVMKPTKEFDSMNTIGLDYAGIVTRTENPRWKVGDRVFGCTFDQGSIASHIVADARFVTEIPPQMTFTEAATLPAVFLTAWYCMVNIAKAQRGQTILVHAASGGVGLVTIQIAKYLGVTVIGTAGSSRKRNFVKSVGVQHVFNSRNLDYGKQIKEVTQGHGVDMVLNCLTGPGFKETSLDILKDGGHFVEIGKVDIWSGEEVAKRRPRVNYNVVYMPDVDVDIVGNLVKQMGELLQTKDILPLPVVAYQGAYLVDALVFLQKAKQIGKVVVQMPVAKRGENGGVEWRERLFNEYSTYLITGGFGDIGMSVATWMVSKGATNLCLVSRRPPTEEVSALVCSLKAQGATVVTRQCDIGDYDQCRRLLEGLGQMPPLRGVHHCAGVIQDGMIGKQEWSNFDKVYKPKIDGTWNLHQLTRNLPLEFFVCYSSLTSTFGNVGQANYTGANAFMDSLVELRHAQGLKALGVNWGQWDAGMAKGLELYSAIPFSIQEGITALEKLMKENKLNATAADVNFRNLLVQCAYLKDNLLADMDLSVDTGKSDQGKTSSGQSSGNSVRESYAACGNDEEKTGYIQSLVGSVAGKILGLSIEDIDVEVNLSDIGMDSMMSIEFTNLLQVHLGDVVIGFVDMDEDGSVERLTTIIRDVLDSENK